MAEIKSLEELQALRERNRNKVRLRHGEADSESGIEILVGMATCGIAAGARETLRALTEEINRRELENIRVVPVGCIGYCQEEPIIMVNMPGQKTCTYGHVTPDKVAQIIESHIIGHKPVESLMIEVDLGPI